MEENQRLNIKQVNQNDKNEIETLLTIWESSVTATHNFLSKDNIEALIPAVKEGLLTIESLYGCYEQEIVGFIGVENEKVEMLFVAAETRGQGIGRKLFQYAIDMLNVNYVDVNEQNEQGLGFYQRMGFHVFGRSELDDQGNAFPILHLKKSKTKEYSNES